VHERLPKVSEWLDGVSQPSLRQLEDLAKATRTPLGYLFLREPPDEKLSIPYFRTGDGNAWQRPSADLLDTVQVMEQRQAWMRDHLVEQGHGPLPFVGSVRERKKPAEVSQMIRQTLGVEGGWASNCPTWSEAFRELLARAEEAGIMVTVSGIVGNNTHRKLDPAEFRGFVLVDDSAPLLFINGADSKAAQMFTLAHELAHIWLGKSAAFDLRELEPADDASEQACNRVAAEFLVPDDELRRVWNRAQATESPFDYLARHFKVSRIVAARRALDAGLISRDEFFAFYEEYQQQQLSTPRREAGGNFYATQNLRIGRRFAEAVVRAAREGKLLYRDAYRLTGLHGETFEKYAERLTGGRP
jgi:Zn-dependent peptidase ImmA (M78 family)